MRIDSKEYSFEKYLSDILTQLKKTVEISNSKIIYLTKDIPLFYHFISETFFAFRHFFWIKSILLHPNYLNAGFTFSELQQGIVSVGREIIKTYNRIPSTEIWNTECMNSVILQVEYYKDAGYFSSASDIRIIYESI